uniref:Amiloride-sensitive sodium channel subunit alpha n=1 Tax=Heterorhabditis bacteriophora TaxID=37862 RepID=A0A1I7XH21_HETBA
MANTLIYPVHNFGVHARLEKTKVSFALRGFKRCRRFIIWCGWRFDTINYTAHREPLSDHLLLTLSRRFASRRRLVLTGQEHARIPQMSTGLCHIPGDIEATIEKEVTFDPNLHSSRLSSPILSAPSETLESVRESIFETTSRFKKRASQIILEVPVNQLRKIKDVEGVGSIHRETKHFAGLNATGDFSNQLLDYLMEFLMDTQILYGTADRPQLHVGEADLQLYIKNNTNFTVEGFFMNAGFECEETMMLCSFGGRYFSCCKYMNPILTNLGKCYSLDMQGSDKEWMRRQTEAGVTAGLQIILDSHLEEQFDGTGGFIHHFHLTYIFAYFFISLYEQMTYYILIFHILILATHLDDPDPIYSDAFENGFRYYVHAPDTIPYLTSEGISVSPSTRVYSAISINSYVLLSSDDWGNCTTHWPHGFNSTLPYSAVNCASICKAQYFYKICGCSPFTYDIDHSYSLCTPHQTVQCIDQNIRKEVNGKFHILTPHISSRTSILETGYFNTPSCKECKMECNSLVYHAYNSYGHGFSNGALTWLNKKNSTWSKPHMRNEYADNCRSYIIFIKDRMDSIFEKKEKLHVSKEESRSGNDFREQEKQLEETVTGFKLFRSRKDGTRDGSMRNTRARLRALSRRISDTLSNGGEITVLKKSQLSAEEREQDTNERREQFMTNCSHNVSPNLHRYHSTKLLVMIVQYEMKIYLSLLLFQSLYMDKNPSQRDSVIELKIDLRDLREQIMNGQAAFNVKTDVGYRPRRRASTVPAPRSTFLSLD